MAENSQVLLVVNPISGGIEKTSLIEFLKRKLEHEQTELFIYYTRGTEDRKHLKKLISENNFERVLVMGGDGTIKLIAEVVKENPIPIGLFPAGSANGLAENLDLPVNVEALAEVAMGDHFIDMDCIWVNDHICLHISDLGLNAELIKNYEEGNIRGKLGYFLQSFPTLLKSDFPFTFTFEIEGEVFQRKGFLLAIANAKKYGTGATINPKGKLNDGRFEILIFKKFDIPQILQTFREDVNLREDFLEIFPAKEVRIECHKSLPFQVDGEYLGEVDRVLARISSLKIKVAVPAEFRT